MATRSFLPQRDCAALIETYDVERVLADIDADHGDRSVEFLRHGVLLVFGAPCQRNLLAGREHGRTIPLPEVPRPRRHHLHPHQHGENQCDAGKRGRRASGVGGSGLAPATLMTGISAIQPK
jgi:hypothetical protein